MIIGGHLSRLPVRIQSSRYGRRIGHSWSEPTLQIVSLAREGVNVTLPERNSASFFAADVDEQLMNEDEDLVHQDEPNACQ
jgi:hypothetical protein